MRNGEVKKCPIVSNTSHCGNARPRWDSSLDLLEWLSSERGEIRGKKELLVHCWQGRKLTQPLWKTVWRVLQKLKIKLAIPLLGTYLKETKSLSPRGICTNMFIAALFIIVNTWKQSTCPLQVSGHRKWYHGKFFSHKKEWKPAIRNNTDRPRQHYANWSKSEKEKYYLISLIN